MFRRINIRIVRRDVDDMQQQARALEMPKELVTQPRALGRAFDQAGNISHDEAAVVIHAHHAKLRMQCRERIVRDLRPCGGDGADQTRFSGVWHTEQADVGEHFEFKLQLLALAEFARCRLARRAIGARLEVEIAEAAFAAFGEQRFGAGRGEIGDDVAAVRVTKHGADRHAQHNVLGAAAVAIRTAAAFAVARLMRAREAVLDQRVQVLVRQCPHAAAAPTITAIGSAARHVLFAPKAHRAFTAVTGDDFDSCFVDEFHTCRYRDRAVIADS